MAIYIPLSFVNRRYKSKLPKEELLCFIFRPFPLNRTKPHCPLEMSTDTTPDPNRPILPVTLRDPIINSNSGETAPSSLSSRGRGTRVEFPTIDGPLGLSVEESIGQARKFFKFGFLLLPWLWAVNCFYFWPVLTKPSSHIHPQLRYYVVRSAIGFVVFSIVLSSWTLTFAIGGEKLFGHVWDQLVMYNLADRFGLTGWI